TIFITYLKSHKKNIFKIAPTSILLRASKLLTKEDKVRKARDNLVSPNCKLACNFLFISDEKMLFSTISTASAYAANTWPILSILLEKSPTCPARPNVQNK